MNFQNLYWWLYKFLRDIAQLEEERLLTSGRSKIPGLKVRMELAWQKEREEHQRLLQETATLARDLRQTLFEVFISIFFQLKQRERQRKRKTTNYQFTLLSLWILSLQIERERSKERLENKRRQDQMKKVFDEEKEENKKKLLEV